MASPDRPARALPYSHGHQRSVLASHATRTAADSCGYLLEGIRPGARILDVGCGPGSITLDLAELAGPDGRVVGIDPSADAIAAARAAAQDRGDVATRFLVAGLEDLDSQLGLFDVVHAHQVLQHLSDPAGALARMARLCAPGGIVAVRDADYAAMAWYPASAGLERWREVYSAGARELGGEPDAGRRVRAWVREAGLIEDWAGSSTWTYASATATQWWGSSQADRVRSSNFAVRAADQGLAPAEIEDIAAAWEQWGRHPDAWFLLPHGEVIARPARD